MRDATLNRPDRVPCPSGGANRSRIGLFRVFVLVLAVAVLAASCARVPRRPPTPPDKHRIAAPSTEAGGTRAGSMDSTAPRPGSMAPPPVSRKQAAAMIFDPARPCFTLSEIDRAREVLFADYRHTDEERWMDALNRVFYELRVDCNDRIFLLLVLTIIQTESGVNIDPVIEKPNLERMFSLKLEAMNESSVLLGRLIRASGLEKDLRAKLRADTRSRKVKTEGDLIRYFSNDLRPWLQQFVMEHYKLPEAVAERVVRAGLPNPVQTIGPMQVNVRKAYRNALKRKESMDSAEVMQARLLDPKTALIRGLKEGVYLLWRPYRFYRRHLDPPAAVLFTSADYNGGEFSSRNAAFQNRVAKLWRRPLALDGDLLVYSGGKPANRLSNTEMAVNVMLPLTAAEIRNDFLLEKEANFWSTDTAREICARFKARLRRGCEIGRLPEGARNERAALKHGRTTTPATYAHRTYRRFRANLRYFDALGAGFLRPEHVARPAPGEDQNAH